LESYYLDALNSAIVVNVQLLCETYLKENSNFTSSKIQSLVKKVKDHVLKAELLPAYEQFNRAICDKATGFGIRYQEGANSFANVKHYQKNPDQWF
jgi:hypothetical protein